MRVICSEKVGYIYYLRSLRQLFLTILVTATTIFTPVILHAATADTSPKVFASENSGAEVRALNRTIAVLRGSFVGVSASGRAERAQDVLVRLLAKKGKGDGYAP